MEVHSFIERVSVSQAFSMYLLMGARPGPEAGRGVVGAGGAADAWATVRWGDESPTVRTRLAVRRKKNGRLRRLKDFIGAVLDHRMVLAGRMKFQRIGSVEMR